MKTIQSSLSLFLFPFHLLSRENENAGWKAQISINFVLIFYFISYLLCFIHFFFWIGYLYWFFTVYPASFHYLFLIIITHSRIAIEISYKCACIWKVCFKLAGVILYVCVLLNRPCHIKSYLNTFTWFVYFSEHKKKRTTTSTTPDTQTICHLIRWKKSTRIDNSCLLVLLQSWDQALDI